MSLQTRLGRFPFHRQLDAMDCGPTCLKMIARHHGRIYSLQLLRERCHLTREGVSFAGISRGAESIGLRTLAVRLGLAQLDEIPLPCVVHWQQRHFVIVYRVERDKVYIADPARALTTYTRDEFMRHWAGGADRTGLVLLLEPTAAFHTHGDPDPVAERTGFRLLLPYLRPHKRYLVQLALGMALGSLLGLVFPFLTQALVDFGINNQALGSSTPSSWPSSCSFWAAPPSRSSAAGSSCTSDRG
jgi:ATP-binding cassette subfamily B protein